MVKRWRVILFGLALLLGANGASAAGLAAAVVQSGTGGTSVFTDIRGHWAETTILKLVGDGILDGYPDGTFRADEAVTVDQFLKILLLSFTQQYPNGERGWTPAFRASLSAANQSVLEQDYRDFTFKPSPVGYWAKPYIDLASDLNLISRTQFPDFKAKLTREKVAEIVYYTMKETEYLEDDTYSRRMAEAFGDLQSATSREQKFIAEVAAKGIMEGYPNGYFGVGLEVTRAEALTILQRIVDKTKRIPVKSGQGSQFETIVPTRDGSYKRVTFPNETMLKAYQVMQEAGKLRGTNYDLTELTLRLYRDAETKANALSRNPNPSLPAEEASMWLEPAYNTYGITVSLQEGAWARNQEAIRWFAKYMFAYEASKFDDWLTDALSKTAAGTAQQEFTGNMNGYHLEGKVLQMTSGPALVISVIPQK